MHNLNGRLGGLRFMAQMAGASTREAVVFIIYLRYA